MNVLCEVADSSYTLMDANAFVTEDAVFLIILLGNNGQHRLLCDASQVD